MPAEHGERRVAEVERQHRVVIDLYGNNLVTPTMLRRADPRHRGDPLRRPEDAGEAVQYIDSNIPERTAGFRVVPGRVG